MKDLRKAMISLKLEEDSPNERARPPSCHSAAREAHLARSERAHRPPRRSSTRPPMMAAGMRVDRHSGADAGILTSYGAPISEFGDVPPDFDFEGFETMEPVDFSNVRSFDTFSTTPAPTQRARAWKRGSPSPNWNPENLTGPLGWTRAPATNPPEFDSSTAISDGWKSTLVQDSDNFLLADPADLTFQDFQNSFFR